MHTCLHETFSFKPTTPTTTIKTHLWTRTAWADPLSVIPLVQVTAEEDTKATHHTFRAVITWREDRLWWWWWWWCLKRSLYPAVYWAWLRPPVCLSWIPWCLDQSHLGGVGDQRENKGVGGGKQRHVEDRDTVTPCCCEAAQSVLLWTVRFAWRFKDDVDRGKLAVIHTWCLFLLREWRYTSSWFCLRYNT